MTPIIILKSAYLYLRDSQVFSYQTLIGNAFMSTWHLTSDQDKDGLRTHKGSKYVSNSLQSKFEFNIKSQSQIFIWDVDT